MKKFILFTVALAVVLCASHQARATNPVFAIQRQVIVEQQFVPEFVQVQRQFVPVFQQQVFAAGVGFNRGFVAFNSFHRGVGFTTFNRGFVPVGFRGSFQSGFNVNVSFRRGFRSF